MIFSTVESQKPFGYYFFGMGSIPQRERANQNAWFSIPPVNQLWVPWVSHYKNDIMNLCVQNEMAAQYTQTEGEPKKTDD